MPSDTFLRNNHPRVASVADVARHLHLAIYCLMRADTNTNRAGHTFASHCCFALSYSSATAEPDILIPSTMRRIRR